MTELTIEPAWRRYKILAPLIARGLQTHGFRRSLVKLMNTVCDYAFDNSMRAAKTLGGASVRSYERIGKKMEQERKEHLDSVQSIKEKIILLNQEMPNGQRARFCTLDYMWRLGGLYRGVGKLGSAKVVGEVYSEEDYRKKLGKCL